MHGPSHVEHASLAPDHLYLEAAIKPARSATGFKLSVIRGNLKYRLSRTYNGQQIQVTLEGFKSVRIKQQGGVNMGSGSDYRDMSERLCLITWILGEDEEIIGGRDYSYDFSALLDARLPRAIKVGSSRIYYRMSADIPKLRGLKTETRLNVPWSRSAIMASHEEELIYEKTDIPMDNDSFMTLEVPKTVIKGPDRSMQLKIYPSKAVSEMHLTHVDVEIFQDVSIYLERLREPFVEPSIAVATVAKSVLQPSCSAHEPLLVNVPLPAEIHAEMRNPHLSCSHELRVTIHRHGVFNRAKVHKQPVVLHHLDLDHWKGKELPLYEDVISKEFNDPFYEYASVDTKLVDEQHNVL